MKRRNFLKAAAAGTAGIVAGNPRIKTAASSGFLSIKEPFHGAILDHRHGNEVNGGLKIRVAGEAPLSDQVLINGTPAHREADNFVTEVVLRNKETDITATMGDRLGHHEHRVRVLWDRYSQPRYQFSIDDCIFFLRDIAQKKYKSLFDCFLLNMFRELHVKYGARFVLNIYFTDEEGFELPQFPDQYKAEWQDNFDWLKLSFHAYQNKPDRIYEYGWSSRLISDLILVREEIIRFAGEQTYIPPANIHWSIFPPKYFKPLYEQGVRVLTGNFNYRDYWDIHYFLDDERCEYISRHKALMDFDSGIIFFKLDFVCNNTPNDQIVPRLESIVADPNQSEIMEIFTHEQYFWPFYPRYVPDHAQRLETAVRWLSEHGYKPVYFTEGLLGGPV